MSFSYSYNQTFTITHAKHLASKIATDLKRIQRFYGVPSDTSISNYEEEIQALLKNGYLKKVIYGFKRDGKYIEPTLIYTAQELANDYANDDDPGKIRPRQDVTNASFSSFLIYSDAWDKLTNEQQNQFKQSITISRGYGSEPGIQGYLTQDKTYTRGGKSMIRTSVKNFK